MGWQNFSGLLSSSVSHCHHVGKSVRQMGTQAYDHGRSDDDYDIDYPLGIVE